VNPTQTSLYTYLLCQPDFPVRERRMIVDLGVWDIRHGRECRWGNDPHHTCLRVCLLCISLLSASLLSDQKHCREGHSAIAMGNHNWLIHILKHGPIDALLQFQSLTYVIVAHLLDQQFQILCFWRETPIHCLLRDIRPILSWRRNSRPFGQSLPPTSDGSEWIC
jgi:hypothetical protein